MEYLTRQWDTISDEDISEEIRKRLRKTCQLLTVQIVFRGFYKLYAFKPPPQKKKKIKEDVDNQPTHRLVLLSVCFICPMSGRYSTKWDRKG